MARLGTSNVERMLLVIANSSDVKGTMGALHWDILESDSTHLYTGRGVEVLDSSVGSKLGVGFQEVGARQDSQGGGVKVEIVIDFDESTITYECQQLKTEKRYGPRTVHYQGKFDGLDCVSFWICGQETQMDCISIQNY